MANFIYTLKLYAINFSKYLTSSLCNYKIFWVCQNVTFFISKFHILVLLHPSLTLIQNSNNSLDHICHLVFLFAHPILFLNGSVLHNDQVCQMIGSAESSVVAGGFVPGGIGNSLQWLLCLSVQDFLLRMLLILHITKII